MTRGYFVDCVTEWGELLELCRDYDCNVCEDIIDDDTLDEYLESDITDAVRSGMSWRDIRDYLDDVDTDYSYYRVDGSFDYEGMTGSDFDEYKDAVLEWMDNGGYWEEEDDEVEDDEEDDDYFSERDFSPSEDEEPSESEVEEEDFSVSDLINMCGAELTTIQKIAEQRRKEDDENMVRLLAV